MSNLNNLQNKALEHTKALLVSFDSSSSDKSLYSSLFDILTENEITDSNRIKILNSFTVKLSEEKKKIHESVKWIDSILKDNK